MNKQKIETIVKWSAPKRIETKYGPRILRSGRPTTRFWNYWRSEKSELKEAGISCAKYQGDWQVSWFCEISESDARDEEKKISDSCASDSNISVPCPAGLSYLPYQRAGIGFCRGKKNVLIADEMGLGKTIQAIGVINDTTPSSVIIICPASLKINWKRELEKWLVDGKIIDIVRGKFQPGNFAANILIVNYDIAGKNLEALKKYNPSLIVFDEAHFLKNPKAARTKAALAIPCDRRIFLTGTPILNRPVELWPILNVCPGLNFGSFFSFAKRFCNAQKNKFGWDFSGASNLEELQRRLRSTIMIRRKKEEVLIDLPAKQRGVIAIASEDMSPAIRRLVASQLEDVGSCPDDANLLNTLNLGFAKYAGARHAIGLAKVPFAIQKIQEELEEGPIVVFAHHRDVIEEIASHFSGCSILVGCMSDREKQDAVDRFQSGQSNVFVGSIQAAGVGITLVRSGKVLFVEQDWTPGIMSQAEDRCHRIGQRDMVLVKHLVLEGSLDERIAKILIEKQGTIAEAIG